ncbi:transcriptional regulator with XRE-family HTH domain [Kineococcus radiotolerans]|uniref:Transcriptional regulator with XRE-family HTH domain n=1 Tax=Kineococcus radiotolerans TaxID=131568 RepID=A0A7W4XUV4_KINRA|nr:helix-turn-helix transcriptional regulator [Kineococcus radiotolerans]MBB2899356.1 transcriptional regulator with XRE-family HTH domain [Kineococcus radiotolerans]
MEERTVRRTTRGSTARTVEHTSLGDFLRSARAAARPEALGLPADPVPGARRVTGLRREEVAQLAGVSVDYYTRLEQGRHSTPSAAVLDALARALQLDAAARAHLGDLTGPVRRSPERVQVQRVRPALAQLLASLVDHPAFIVGRRTDVLAANALARALMTDWQRLPARERNYTRWLLLDPAAREVHRDWEQVAAEAVGALRLDAGRHPDDPLLNELVGELTIKSEPFRTWWNAHRVHERTHGTKRLQHPAIGAITIRFQALTLPGEADQTLFLYTTDPGSSSADNLRLLASWATRPAGGSSPGSTPGAVHRPGDVSD